MWRGRKVGSLLRSAGHSTLLLHLPVPSTALSITFTTFATLSLELSASRLSGYALLHLDQRVVAQRSERCLQSLVVIGI